eukprot:PLAT3299.6.p1 GENE.PLAT3299.6~~PLAT3299.6.p1  ORF type:complete len:884 (-),score=381.09 PLAT3299.6:1129-3387(-)
MPVIETDVVSVGDLKVERHVLEFLSVIPHITALNDITLLHLRRRLERQRLPASRVLFREGDVASNGMYIIVHGELGLFHETADGTSRLLSTFTRGMTVGESTLLAGPSETYAVTARVTRDCELLRLGPDTFDWLVSEHSSFVTHFILSTTARQWRVAHHVLAEFLPLPTTPKLCRDSPLPAFSADELDRVRAAATGTLNLSNGERLLAKEDAADALFVVLSGVLVAEGGAELLPGCIVGGVACLAGVRHMESADVSADAEVAVFPRRLFDLDAEVDDGSDGGEQEDEAKAVDVVDDDDAAAAADSASASASSSAASSSPAAATRSAVLMRLTLATAQCMTPLLRQFLQLGLQRVWFKAGERLFNEGDDVDALYLVISGRLRTVFDSGDAPVEVGRGQCVGEASVLAEDAAFDYSAVCIRDSELVRVSTAAFEEVSGRFPSVLLPFMRQLARRMKTLMSPDPAASRLGSAPRNLATIALVPAGVRAPNLKQFAQRLTAALSVYGTCVHIDSAAADAQLRQVGGSASRRGLRSMFAGTRLAAWLTELEESHQFIVFESDQTATTWTKCAIRHADAVLLVAEAEGHCGLSSVERECLFHTHSLDAASTISRKELVLCHHDDSQLPQGTRKWFIGRTFRSHHHVRTQQVGDYERMARILTGNAVGVVLGGGGSRGLAHVGAIKAILESGIPIDYIGGTSQGAFMSGTCSVLCCVACCVWRAVCGVLCVACCVWRLPSSTSNSNEDRTNFAETKTTC